MMQLTRGLGIVGLVFLVFAIIALALTKLTNWYFWIHIGLGVLCILLYFVFNFDTFLERVKERSTTEGSKVFVYATIVLAIIVGLNIISFRKSKRWDVTENKIFSLEQQSMDVLKSLTAPVKVTGYFQIKSPQRPAFEQITEIYQRQSDFFKSEIFDPDKVPDLASQYNVKDGDIRIVFGQEDELLSSFDEDKVEKALTGRVQNVFYFGESSSDETYMKLAEMLGQGDLVARDINLQFYRYDNTPPSIKTKPNKGSILIRYASKDTVITEVSEQALTNAIIQVSTQETPTVYFSTGHGERLISVEDENGLSALKGGIQNEGYDVRSMTKTLVQGVPADADVLVIPGLIAPLTEVEVDSVNAFLENGGKVIVLADVQFNNPKLDPEIKILDTGLTAFAAKWGLALGNNIVLERHRQLFEGVTTDPYVIARDYGNHPIVEPMKELTTYFQVARSVAKAPDANPDLKITELIRSASGAQLSWAESDVNALIQQQKAEFGEGDIAGPVPLAAAVEKNLKEAGKTAKLVVFGDVDFISNRYIRQNEFNYDLFLNTVNWMWGKQKQITIRPKQLRSSKLILTPTQTAKIFYFAVLLIPELILILGFVIYWRRKSR